MESKKNRNTEADKAKALLIAMITTETLDAVHKACQSVLVDNPVGLLIYSELLESLGNDALALSARARQSHEEYTAAVAARVAKAKAEAEAAIHRAAKQ